MVKRQIISKTWFQELRNQLCETFELIESEYAMTKGIKTAKFHRTSWKRGNNGGGGTMSIMKGNVFEKVGVNVSTVYGKLSQEFKHKIPGTEEDPTFFATGISLVAHMLSPLIPAMHFNTRYIETKNGWFGGGADLTPIYPDNSETAKFHSALKSTCDKYSNKYYTQFKKQCDEYFYLHHRNESRGEGGIFYDYMQNDLAKNFAFTQDVGRTIVDIYPKIVRNKMYLNWTEKQREYQLIKRGRYVEFNLLYDRGTAFGLSTGGNIEAILMSMPPEVKWL